MPLEIAGQSRFRATAQQSTPPLALRRLGLLKVGDEFALPWNGRLGTVVRRKADIEVILEGAAPDQEAYFSPALQVHPTGQRSPFNFPASGV